MAVIVVGIVVGIIIALIIVGMTWATAHYFYKGFYRKENLTISKNTPLRFRDECTPNDVGTLRCVTA